MAMTSVPTLAGIASTVIFAWSVLPMLAKAHRTRDLASYSLGNLVLANLGNAVHSVYVFSLPAGPIWVLHGFYLATSWLMLIWCLRYRRVPGSTQTTPHASRAKASAVVRPMPLPAPVTKATLPAKLPCVSAIPVFFRCSWTCQILQGL